MHLLRHTSGSLIYRRTSDVKLAQEWLGHSSSRITMDTYVHLMKDTQKQTAEVVFTRPKAAAQSNRTRVFDGRSGLASGRLFFFQCWRSQSGIGYNGTRNSNCQMLGVFTFHSPMPFELRH